MTQNTSKNILNWTEKHLKYCLKYRVGNVAQTLWKWLLTLPKYGDKIEFALKEFQEYVKKLRGKSHAMNWVKLQLDKLVFLRIISVDKDFGHNTYRIELRHPDDIKPKIRKERNLHYHQVSLEKHTSNTAQCETGDISSSTIDNASSSLDNTDSSVGNKVSHQPETKKPLDLKEHYRKLQIIKACAKFGIFFHPKKSTTEEIYKYPIEDITASLELFAKRNQRGTITNPKGFLIDCLRYRFYEDDLYTEESFIADIREIFTSISNNSE